VIQLCLLYLLAFLDRTNIGNAKIANLTKDVPMDTTHYNLTLTIFFIAYAAFEALANILLKRFKPSRFLPATMYVGSPICRSPAVADYFLGLSGAFACLAWAS
jgi:sugar phosphate permease